MSRSRRRTPIFGNACAESEKDDKRHANRRLRRAARIALDKGDDVLPEIRDVSNVWSFAKDGKNHYSMDDYRRALQNGWTPDPPDRMMRK